MDGRAPEGTITGWIERLKRGDDAAAQRLWEVYFGDLVRLARKRLGGMPRRAADEEDVALSAFKSLCLGAARGRFPRLIDRDNLWRLLLVITVRKAQDLAAREGRLKRGGGRARIAADGGGGESECLEAIAGSEPTPELAALMAEEYQALLDLLDDEMRAIAILKMEGFTNEEIAKVRGCVPRTIERKLGVIRQRWSRRRSP